MTACVPALPREPEVQSRIQTIRTFGRRARTFCAVLFGIGLVATVVSVVTVSLTGIPAPRLVEGSAVEVLASVLTPLQARSWWVLCQLAVTAVGLAILFQLYRLFRNLAGGAIHTAENVGRVRRVGLLLLVSATLGVVLPAMTLAIAIGVTDVPVSASTGVIRSIGDAIGSFFAAGLVLLASWIMDVGLFEKEHADELRRDSDLMI